MLKMFKKSAFDLLEEENTKSFRIQSFIRGLDKMLEGGIPSGIITEFCGGPDMATYISEKLFSSGNVLITEEEFLSNVEYIYCNTTEEIMNVIKAIKDKILNEENIKLIVIDSFASLFRNFNGRTQLRMKIIYEILNELQILADKFEIAVIITNEFSTKILEDNEMVLYPALGEAYAHKIGQRIIFEKGKLQRRIFLYKTLYAPSVLIPFMIDNTGIRSINSTT